MQRFFFLQVDDKNSGDYSADKTTKWIAIKKRKDPEKLKLRPRTQNPRRR